jgi:DNA-binding IclR family transcriptional regulator
MTNKKSQSTYTHRYYEPPKSFVKSATRAFSVLEYFYRNRLPARAVEICRHLDLPVSSTKYLLTSLVESGYLTFDKTTKKYFPSILFTGFASWLSGIYPNGEVLRQLARETHQKLGATISITVQHEQYMRALIIEMDGDVSPPSYDFRVRIPLVGSAGGLLVLASLPDREITELLNKEFARLHPDERQEKCNQTWQEVRQTRERGYSKKYHNLTIDDRITHLVVVCVPIPMPDNMPPMVLAISTTDLNCKGQEDELAKSMRIIINKYRNLLGAPADK